MRIVAIIIFFGSYVVAQPGYQGKKLAVGYSSAVGINFTTNTYQNENSGFSLMVKHVGSVEYTVTRHTSLGFSVGYQRLGSENISILENIYSKPVYAKIRNIQPSLYVKFFSKKNGNLSPFGLYYKLMVSQNYYKALDSVNDKVLAQLNDNYGLTFGIGKTRIIKNAIIVDYSLDFAVNLGTDSELSEEGSEIMSAINYSLGVNNIILFKVGLGWLPPIR